MNANTSNSIKLPIIKPLKGSKILRWVHYDENALQAFCYAVTWICNQLWMKQDPWEITSNWN